MSSPFEELFASIRGRNLEREVNKWLSHQSKKSIKKLVKRSKHLRMVYHIEKSAAINVEDRDHQNKKMVWVFDRSTNARYKITLASLLGDYWAIDGNRNPMMLIDLLALNRGCLPNKNNPGKKLKSVVITKREEPKPILFLFDEVESDNQNVRTRDN